MAALAMESSILSVGEEPGAAPPVEAPEPPALPVHAEDVVQQEPETAALVVADNDNLPVHEELVHLPAIADRPGSNRGVFAKAPSTLPSPPPKARAIGGRISPGGLAPGQLAAKEAKGPGNSPYRSGGGLSSRPGKQPLRGAVENGAVLPPIRAAKPGPDSPTNNSGGAQGLANNGKGWNQFNRDTARPRNQVVVSGPSEEERLKRKQWAIEKRRREEEKARVDAEKKALAEARKREAEEAALEARRAAIRERIARQHEVAAKLAEERMAAEEHAREEVGRFKSTRPLYEKMEEEYEMARAQEELEKKRMYDEEIAVNKNVRPHQIMTGEKVVKPRDRSPGKGLNSEASQAALRAQASVGSGITATEIKPQPKQRKRTARKPRKATMEERAVSPFIFGSDPLTPVNAPEQAQFWRESNGSVAEVLPVQHLQSVVEDGDMPQMDSPLPQKQPSVRKQEPAAAPIEKQASVQRQASVKKAESIKKKDSLPSRAPTEPIKSVLKQEAAADEVAPAVEEAPAADEAEQEVAPMEPEVAPEASPAEEEPAPAAADEETPAEPKAAAEEPVEPEAEADTAPEEQEVPAEPTEEEALAELAEEQPAAAEEEEAPAEPEAAAAEEEEDPAPAAAEEETAPEAEVEPEAALAEEEAPAAAAEEEPVELDVVAAPPAEEEDPTLALATEPEEEEVQAPAAEAEAEPKVPSAEVEEEAAAPEEEPVEQTSDI